VIAEWLRDSMIARDVRVAARSLSRSRGFALTAILSLSIAIAVNTTIYSLFDALIFPRIDVRQVDQLYRLRYFGDVHHRLPFGGIERALQSGLHGYEGVSGFRRYSPGEAQALAERGTHSRDVRPLVVRQNLFTLLGTHARRGRLFTAADSNTSAPLAVISDRLEAALFPDGESPVGQRIDLDGRPFTVIGVLPSYARVAALDADMWILPEPGASNAVAISVVRLRDGITPASADGELSVLAARLAIDAGESPRDTRFFLSGRAEQQFRLGGFHYALIAAVIAVLLVACGNLANLQLARGMGRGPELALRSALGASRGQIVRTIMVENVLLAGVGLVLGFVATFWAVDLLAAVVPAEIGGLLVKPQTSWRMLVVAVAAGLVCLLLVGLVPAVRLARADPNTLLKRNAGTGAHRHNRRMYGLMLVAQIGFALPLLIGAAFLTRSVARLDGGDYVKKEWFGYDPHPLVTAVVPLQAPRGSAVSFADAASDLVSRTRAIDGVIDAAASHSAAPVNKGVAIEDAGGLTREVPAPAWTYTIVTPGYFRSYGRQMARGKDFVDGVYDAPPVVIDEPTAKFLWPGVDPVGRLLKLGNVASAVPWSRVIGVVHDLRDPVVMADRDPTYGRRLAGVYRVVAPTDSLVIHAKGESIGLIARARGEPHRVAVGMQHALRTPGSTGALSVATLEDRAKITLTRVQQRFVRLILTIFASLGVGLAALGVYGIVSHSVNERQREFGVRISLGATPRHILRDVLREWVVLALAGVAVGLYLSRTSVGWLGLFLVNWDDFYNPVLFAAMSLMLCVTALLAALAPAWRATRVDPVDALRNE